MFCVSSYLGSHLLVLITSSTAGRQLVRPSCACHMLRKAASALLQQGISASLTQCSTTASAAEILGPSACQAIASCSGRPFGSAQAAAAAGQRKKRFYESVAVAQDPIGDGYNVLLNGRPVRTPGKHVLQLPTYPLALAVAAEWEWLEKGKPIVHAMPMMSLVATAIDQPKERSKVMENLLNYIHTDAACIRDEPGPLAERQAKVFGPLLHWAEETLGWHLTCTHSIFGTNQGDATLDAVRKYLTCLDSWHLAAVEQLTSASKSLVVAAAVVAGRVSVEQGIAMARLEEEFQLEDWGMVEAGHDLDIADMGARVAAPALLVRLLRMGGAGLGVTDGNACDALPDIRVMA